jgi:hypothetical protein
MPAPAPVITTTLSWVMAGMLVLDFRVVVASDDIVI